MEKQVLRCFSTETFTPRRANFIIAQYAACVAAGRIDPDAGQLAVVERLAALEARIALRCLARKSSALGWPFAKRENALPRIKSLYIPGDIGRGKTS